MGGDDGERVRHSVQVVLVPEPQNPYDGNAVTVAWLDKLSGSYGPQDVVTLRKLIANERDPIDRHGDASPAMFSVPRASLAV